jgi:GNAT superfamily N-acetyltransferase
LSDKLLIRGVRPSDFTEWKPLWDAYNAFYGRTGDTALADETTAMTWSRFFDPYEPMHALVAERSGRLLGLAHLIFHRSTISPGSVCYLQDLFTSASARSEGIGRALIEEIYRYAEQGGCNRVYWQTHETNATAMKLYDKVAEKSGFVVYRTIM